MRVIELPLYNPRMPSSRRTRSEKSTNFSYFPQHSFVRRWVGRTGFEYGFLGFPWDWRRSPELRQQLLLQSSHVQSKHVHFHLLANRERGHCWPVWLPELEKLQWYLLPFLYVWLGKSIEFERIPIQSLISLSRNNSSKCLKGVSIEHITSSHLSLCEWEWNRTSYLHGCFDHIEGIDERCGHHPRKSSYKKLLGECYLEVSGD